MVNELYDKRTWFIWDLHWWVRFELNYGRELAVPAGRATATAAAGGVLHISTFEPPMFPPRGFKSTFISQRRWMRQRS